MVYTVFLNEYRHESQHNITVFWDFQQIKEEVRSVGKT